MVEPESAARTHSEEVAAIGANQNWAMSEETLLILSLVSDEACEKADRLRKELQHLSRANWLSEQGNRLRLATAEELEDAWAAEVGRQDREWSQRRQELDRAIGDGDSGNHT